VIGHRPGDPPAGTLLLTRRDVAELLPMDACIDVVERAFREHAEGRTPPPGVLGAHVEGGGFHVKTAALALGRPYFAAKVNANFPGNRERFGLPTIQGVIALFDAVGGRLLALLDSTEVTALRTAAATAVAAKYLARRDAAVVTICGCGAQGRAQLRALARVRPVRLVLAVDAEVSRAEAYAREMSRELGLDVRAAGDLAGAARRSDACVTCTTVRSAILHPGDVAPGAFVAAVGADNAEKQEIDPMLLAASTVVVDVLEQCATMGDLHHALDAGAMTRADVHAELGEVVAGSKPGRRSDHEIIVFDSTGTALQDVAAAGLVYERAVAAGRGRRLALA
jgi:alanine dehydrogenase